MRRMESRLDFIRSMSCLIRSVTAGRSSRLCSCKRLKLSTVKASREKYSFRAASICSFSLMSSSSMDFEAVAAAALR